MSAQSHNVSRVSDLASGCVSGFGAMVIMGYLANVTKPGIVDTLLALISVTATAVAVLCIWRANIDPSWKTTIIIGGAGVCLLYLRFLT